jgi:hypothetical protein
MVITLVKPWAQLPWGPEETRPSQVPTIHRGERQTRANAVWDRPML